MPRRKQDDTKTTDFELEGIEEATAPAPAEKRISPETGWKPTELPKLQVERPRELEGPGEHEAKIWILERRARGLIAAARRWIFGKKK